MGPQEVLSKETEPQMNGGVLSAHLPHAPWNLAGQPAGEFQTQLLGGAGLVRTRSGAELHGGGSPAACPRQGGWKARLGSDGLGISFPVSHC